MGVFHHSSSAGILSGDSSTRFSVHGAKATPEQTNPVRTAGSERNRRKPKEIIVGYSNQES